MLMYEFLEKRFDQLNEESYLDAEHMVDGLFYSNEITFQKVNSPNQDIEDICLELWRELDQINNPDIPF